MPQIASRFRPNHHLDRAEAIPHTVGLCRYCLREMWASLGDRSGVTRASEEIGTCTTCLGWKERNPGGDPRTMRGAVAERIPQEMPERDPSWRVELTQRCRGIDPGLFEPDDFRPGLQVSDEDRREQWEVRRMIANRVCLPCQSRDGCRRTALEQGYEGLWGGVFFRRETWVNLVNGVTGSTTSKRGNAAGQAA